MTDCFKCKEPINNHTEGELHNHLVFCSILLSGIAEYMARTEKKLPTESTEPEASFY